MLQSALYVKNSVIFNKNGNQGSIIITIMPIEAKIITRGKINKITVGDIACIVSKYLFVNQNLLGYQADSGAT